MDSVDSEVTPVETLNHNSDDGNCEEETNVLVHHKQEGAPYTNQEYLDMKDDPSMRYVLSQRPAAGYPSPHVPHNTEPTPTGRRHYKTANETNESTSDSTPIDLSTNHRQEPEEISYSSQEYVAMKGDPSMNHVYSSERAAAGNTSPHRQRQDMASSPKSRRHYQVASDITDSGRNRSGNSSPPGQGLIQPIPDVPSPLNMSPSRHRKPEGSLYSNQEYVDMKDDPSMRLVYSSQRPAAGYPSPHVPNNAEPAPTGRRHYKTAGDANDTEMGRSGSSSPWPESTE